MEKVLGLVVASCLVLAAPGRSPAADPAAPRRLDAAPLDRAVAQLLEAHGEGIQASIWVGGPTGGAWYARQADVARPTASAIKTAYLVELFAAHAGKLDAPLPGAERVLDADGHPALAPFPAAERDTIRQALRGATVRRVGEIMIRSGETANGVYNAAANVTTAVLGGPAALTQKIHARDAAFRDLAARRYMLAARNVTGDNEATAAALAAVLQRLAARRLAGVDEETLRAIREVLRRPEVAGSGSHFAKGGTLDSDPLTRVRSGWWETPQGTFVYVVMTVQPGPGQRSRAEAGKRLAQTCDALTERVVAAARQALGR